VALPVIVEAGHLDHPVETAPFRARQRARNNGVSRPWLTGPIRLTCPTQEAALCPFRQSQDVTLTPTPICCARGNVSSSVRRSDTRRLIRMTSTATIRPDRCGPASVVSSPHSGAAVECYRDLSSPNDNAGARRDDLASRRRASGSGPDMGLPLDSKAEVPLAAS
jgi:hypothetical protein